MTALPRLAVPALALGLLGTAGPPAAADQTDTATESITGSITESAPAPASSAPGLAVAGGGVLAVIGSAVVARRRSGAG